MDTSKFKKSLLFLSLFLIATGVLGQSTQPPSGSDINNAVNTQWTQYKQILQLICTIVIAIGGVGLAVAYLTNRQESKDHLVKWIVGLVIISILRATVLA